jgi:serine-type D-Ala-D-Ala carboxypeptidase/endopeptidase (penicillin-binding protein 4)
MGQQWRWLVTVVIGLIIGAPPAVAQSSSAPRVCPAQLGDRLNQIVRRTGGRWSVLVQTQGAPTQRQNLANYDGSVLLVPASNTKVLTTAAALRRLGSQYRIRTSVLGNANAPTLATLRIVGRGDPSLSTPQLNTLAQQLVQKGVRQVTQLIGDDTTFRGPTINPFWDPEDAGQAYATAVNSLILNQNIIGLAMIPQRVGQPLVAKWDDPTDAPDWILDNQTVTVAPTAGESIDMRRDAAVLTITGQLRAGSEPELVGVAVPNPGNYLVRKFRMVLNTAKITVGSSTLVRLSPAPATDVELAAVESPPMSKLIFETNQESNNIYAEALLKTLGIVQNPASPNATDSGIAAVRAALTQLGVNPNRYSMVDGSGLADRNRVSAEALVQALQGVALLPDARLYRDSLPVAGVTGTLKNRFRNTPAQGTVFAKTGTITGVVSLAGYVTPPNHPPLVFGMIVNSSQSPSAVRRSVDEFVVLLAQLQRC